MDHWDRLASSAEAGRLHQCVWWSQPLAAAGVKTKAVSVWREGTLVGGAAFRSIPIPRTGACVTQCLSGPILSSWRPGWAEDFVAEVELLAREHNSIEIAFEGCAEARAHHDLCSALRRRGAAVAFRPGPVHAVVPLDGVELDAARRRMSEGARRNIKKAEKSGLRVAAVSASKDLERAHEAWLSTARRKSFGDVRPWRYLEPAVKRCLDEGLGTVLAAFKDDRLLASIFVTFIGGAGVYVYGGFVDGAEPYSPNHVLHLEAVKLCLERGLKTYDLGAMNGEPGLNRFKLGFGAEARPQLDTIVWRRRPLLSRAYSWARRSSAGRRLVELAKRRLLVA
jgi:hypothetical protein